MRYAATGESMPPESRHASRPLGPGRQPAGARFLAEEVERVVGQHLEVDGQIRLVEIDPPALGLLDQPADLALDLRRREGKALVGAARADAKARRWRSPRSARIARGQRLEVVRRPAGQREIGDAEHAADAIAGLVEGRRSDPRSISMRPMTERTPVTSSPFSAAADCGPATGRTTGGCVPSAPVPCSARLSSACRDEAASAARWPLRTALSIVAGSPVSIQSPARNKPRTDVRVDGRGGWPGASEKVARGSRMTVARSDCGRPHTRQRLAEFAVRRLDQLGVRPAQTRRRRSTPARGATPFRRTRPACRTPTASSGREARQTARPYNPIEPHIDRDDRRGRGATGGIERLLQRPHVAVEGVGQRVPRHGADHGRRRP